MIPTVAISLALLAVLTGSEVLIAQSPDVQRLYRKARADQAAGNDQAAVADYEKLLQLDPSVAPAYNNLGRLLYNLGRFSEAIATLEKGLALQPDMAPAQVLLGASYLETGDPAKALAPLQRGVQALPDDRFARLTLTRTLTALGRRDDAVTELRTLVAHDPKDQEAWYLLGKLELEQSQAAFAQVQALDPNSPLAHQISGEIMESMGNTPGAVAEYKAAIVAAPENAPAMEHLADIYWTTGDFAHAREAYTTLLAKQPGNCKAHWRLANSLDELGETTEVAMTEIQTALKACPALPQAHAERARLFLRMKQPAEALPDLKFAEAAAPDEPSVQRMLAETYRALGDRTRADEANLRFQHLVAAEHAAKEQHAARVVQANQ